ncbi:MAG: zinc finger MYND domain-containing protein [Promethearchaeota archaeon]
MRLNKLIMSKRGDGDDGDEFWIRFKQSINDRLDLFEGIPREAFFGDHQETKLNESKIVIDSDRAIPILTINPQETNEILQNEIMSEHYKIGITVTMNLCSEDGSTKEEERRFMNESIIENFYDIKEYLKKALKTAHQNTTIRIRTILRSKKGGNNRYKYDPFNKDKTTDLYNLFKKRFPKTYRILEVQLPLSMRAKERKSVLDKFEAECKKETGAEKMKTICNKCKDIGDAHKVCSRCKIMFYCSKDCQIKHWKEHRKICKKH